MPLSEGQEDRIVRQAREAELAQRSKLLDALCGGDDSLRQRVEVLLSAQVEPVGVLGSTVVDSHIPELKAQALAEEGPGAVIGRYRLLEKIGEGGFGAVYVAEQKEPVKRRVALKIIKLGMDTKQVVARFESERQALALMDHPNIAKVLDAGATATGRPYFVMELVRGIPITQHCDQNSLPTEDRLKLFTQVCQAIQHAHQKGIIHRDIKPSNILVTVSDGVAVPKVIDFGIAKATAGQELTDKTVYTQLHQFIGTPAYMSPEQAEMSAQDIDTRSDIYSLGVLLYELLVGRTPFDPRELLQLGLDAMRRAIREKEPMRPSTRLGSIPADERTTVARQRASKVPGLISLLRGDLDWIVMKCLEKDRTLRYETANGLAMDVQRFLNSEPVTARRPSAAYRVQKFVRRNKLMVAAAGAFATMLVLGVLASSWEAIRAKRAEREQFTLLETAQKAKAKEAQERQRAQSTAIELRRKAYAAEINVAFQALAENNLERAVQLLERQRPKGGQEDLRGFEWRYLWSLCQDGSEATFSDAAGNGVAYSPDGRCVAYSGGGEGDIVNRLIIRDAFSHTAVTNLPVGMAVSVSLSFSSRTNLLASADDSRVKFWDTKTWQEIPIPLPGAAHLAKFSPDGRWLLTGPMGHIQLWNTETWQVAATCPVAFFHWPMNVAFSPDSRFLAMPDRDGLKLSEELRVRTVPDLNLVPGIGIRAGSIRSTAFTVDGKQLLVGFDAGGVSVWDFKNQTLVDRLPGHTGAVWAATASPDGKLLATASADRIIQLWDATNRRHLATLRGHLGEIFGLAFSPDSRTLASIEVNGPLQLKLWNTGIRDHKEEMEGTGLVVGIGPDSTLYAASEEGLRVWNLTNNTIANLPLDLHEVLGQDLPRDPIALANDLPLLAVAKTNGEVEVSNLATKSVPKRWRARRTERVLDISSDGKWLATSGFTNEVSLWDAATGKELAALGPVKSDVACVRFSPDGRMLAVTTASGHDVSVWNIAARLQIGLFALQRDYAGSLEFSPDGQLLAAARENDVFLWSVGSRQLKTVFKGHVQEVRAIAFSPDGKTLVTGSDDQKLKFWHLATVQELMTLPLEGGCYSLKFSPDGRVLACGLVKNAVRSIQLWRAPFLAEIDAATQPNKTAENTMQPVK